MSFCAIDFGTSNSAIAVPGAGSAMRLVELEAGFSAMPTAVFYAADGELHGRPLCEFGRAAVAAYVDGLDGRLMRSMKSILGSTLVEQTTDIGGGRAVPYLDVVASFLAHLKGRAEAAVGAPIDRAVLGRPVFFVDDDPGRDALAQAALEKAARRAGFRELAFQYEPIAAAFDYEQGVAGEEKVLVADIGGGTSDFSIVRVGPERQRQSDRKGDILANHGVHVAGTDFDRRIELASMLPLLGYGAFGPEAPGQAPREVPSAVYFDLATWHLVNTVYNPLRVAELRSMRSFYADPAQHRRLLRVVTERLGHDLVARAEAAKIAVAGGGAAIIDLGRVEPGLIAPLDEATARDALGHDLDRIVAAAQETARLAGLVPGDIQALYFTGGSTGLALLVDRLQRRFPAARAIRGDRFASVATGLAL
ncbi:MAG: Hsp70 family protein, partial [Caldimonas sp.]